jgi:Na+-translocating ferredoxin:NAD+ oxidoreductase RnfE subunit
MRVGPPYEFDSMGIGFTIMLLVMGAIREGWGAGRSSACR